MKNCDWQLQRPVKKHIRLMRAGRALDLTYFSKGTAKTQMKRNHKAMLLVSIQAGAREPPHGMTIDEATTMLSQDIADYDEILARLRKQDDA